MSMGYSACFSEHIEDDKLKKVLGSDAGKLDELKALIDKLSDGDNAENTDDIVRWLDEEDDSYLSNDELTETDDYRRLQTLWTEIMAKVREETGLNLYINYHDSRNNGSSYDDVDGVFFDFNHKDLYQPTKKFQELRKKFGEEIVTRHFYTEFG